LSFNNIYRGNFYTPEVWVQESHKYIKDILNVDWTEKYIVWDCCSGSGNLTKNINIKSLYRSTIDEEEVNNSIFQYDFLDDNEVDGIGEKIPFDLKSAFLNDNSLLFLINPPYGTSGSGGYSKQNKRGLSKNKVSCEMRRKKIGRCANQIYAQFLYKILRLKIKYNLSDINIAIFSKPSFMSSVSFSKFRKIFYSNFKFIDGFLFNASCFDNVSEKWGVSFTFWGTGKNVNNDIFLSVKNTDKQSLKMEEIGKKRIYNADNNPSSKWIRKETKHLKTFDAPQMTSALNIKNKGCMRGSLVSHFLGFFLNGANNISSNETDVSLFSSCYAMGNGVSITPDNFMKVVSLFAARKVVKRTWINDKDEYLKPNVSHFDYEQWNNDCIIYSLFNPCSYQSSLRDIKYKGKKWNIVNHFFFMSKNKIGELGKEYFYELYEDYLECKNEAFVYNKIEETNFSLDAENILNKARSLVEISLEKRKKYNKETNNKYHLSAWDASFAQLKGFWKKCYKEEYKDFIKSYRKFGDRLEKEVYKLGFLKE